MGAIRLARLNSPWARRRYRKHPKKLARAEHREARLRARWLAWRDAFFDLIAGRPHLPSLPPSGAEAPVPTPGEPVAVAADAPAVDAGPGETS